MKKVLLTIVLSTALTAQAADLTSCSATYTVASGAFANANDSRSADGAAYLAGQTKLLATNRQWGNNEQLSTSMYKQALNVQQSKFKSQGWDSLSRDLSECKVVVDRYISR